MIFLTVGGYPYALHDPRGAVYGRYSAVAIGTPDGGAADFERSRPQAGCRSRSAQVCGPVGDFCDAAGRMREQVSVEDDPGLPIKFGPCSNGEYVPAPLTAVERAASREGYEACAANARALGMSRREFMFTATAAATTLLVLEGCDGGSKKSEPGGRYTVPSEAGKDIGAARHALSGEEFVFDVQGHHL